MVLLNLWMHRATIKPGLLSTLLIGLIRMVVVMLF
jgi:hypothetical protein